MVRERSVNGFLDPRADRDSEPDLAPVGDLARQNPVVSSFQRDLPMKSAHSPMTSSVYEGGVPLRYDTGSSVHDECVAYDSRS